jgi:hypothetical protein
VYSYSGCSSYSSGRDVGSLKYCRQVGEIGAEIIEDLTRPSLEFLIQTGRRGEAGARSHAHRAIFRPSRSASCRGRIFARDVFKGILPLQMNKYMMLYQLIPTNICRTQEPMLWGHRLSNRLPLSSPQFCALTSFAQK